MSGLTVFFGGDKDASYERSVISHPPAPAIEQQQEQPLSYSSWRQQRNELLQAYMEARVVGEAQEEEVDGDAQDDSTAAAGTAREDAGGIAEDPEQEPESQQEQQSQDESNTQSQQVDPAAVAEAVPAPEPSIPPLRDTRHDVQHLQDLTLSSRSISLRVCNVTQIAAPRHTRRSAVVQAWPRPQRCLPDNRLPRLLLDPVTEDGPLSTCYKQVVSLQVQPITQQSELRQRAEAAASGASAVETPQVLPVFLYRAYAMAVEKILKQHNNNNNTKLLMSLQNIPAISVMPFPGRDWYERDCVVEYCLCIGGPSSMRMATNDTRLRFDGYPQSNRMAVHVAVVGTDPKKQNGGSCTEYCIQPDQDGQVEFTRTATGPLTLYVAQQQQQQREKEQREKEQREKEQREKEQQEKEQREKEQQENDSEGDFEEKKREQAEAPSRAVPPANGTRTARAQAQTSPGRMSHQQRRIIEYIKLSDLKSHFDSYEALAKLPDSVEPGVCVVSLYGVVLGFGSPARTKRNDWMIGVALVDPTLQPPQGDDTIQGDEAVKTININIFTKHKEDLPKIQYAGDVLRMHRVRLQKWGEEMQLMGMRASSYVVARKSGDSDGDDIIMTYIPTAKSEFSLTEDDKRYFIELWTWGQDRLLERPSMKLSQAFKLYDMQRQDNGQLETYGDDNHHGDLTVMVCAIIPTDASSGVTARGFLRVWDGTGFPASDPLPLPTAAASEAVKNGDPPSQALVRIAAIIQKLRDRKPDLTIEAPQVLTGRVANVAIWEDSHWELVQKAVKVGSFIRLRNVHDTRMPVTNLRCLMVFTKSYLTPLPDLSYEVVQIFKEHNERLLHNEPLNPHSGILPLEVGGDHAAPAHHQQQEPSRGSPPVAAAVAPLDNRPRLVSLLSGPVPFVFSGPVRIKATIPSLTELVSLGLEQICCDPDASGHRDYRFAVRLEDDSNTLDAIVAQGSNAGPALFGMSAVEALGNATRALDNLDKVLKAGGRWNAQLRSVAYQGTKFFLIERLDKE